MKFNKSSLLSSLAVAGMVLGAVAPVVASAAQDDTVFSNNGQNSAFDDTGTPVALTENTASAALNGTNGYATSVQQNNDSGSATGVSDGYVRLVSGYLTLDAVPDFNFGTVAVGATAKLAGNNGKFVDDGNADGLLKVTDSRSSNQTADTAETPTPAPSRDGRGYTLAVKLGSFYPGIDPAADGKPQTRTGTPDNNFTLTIPSPADKTDAKGNALVTSDTKSLSFSDNTKLVAGGAQSTFFSAPNKKSYGSVSIKLTTDAGITLATDPNAKAGGYDAPIYWILSGVIPVQP